jgi:hypothetical protein
LIKKSLKLRAPSRRPSSFWREPNLFNSSNPKRFAFLRLVLLSAAFAAAAGLIWNVLCKEERASNRQTSCRAQTLHPYPAGPPRQKPSSIGRLWPLSTFAENSWLYSPAMGPLDAGVRLDDGTNQLTLSGESLSPVTATTGCSGFSAASLGQYRALAGDKSFGFSI